MRGRSHFRERAEFPHELVPKLAQLGITGFQIEGYGCPGMSNVTAGMAIMELARGDVLTDGKFTLNGEGGLILEADFGVPGGTSVLSMGRAPVCTWPT